MLSRFVIDIVLCGGNWTRTSDLRVMSPPQVKFQRIYWA